MVVGNVCVLDLKDLPCSLCDFADKRVKVSDQFDS